MNAGGRAALAVITVVGAALVGATTLRPLLDPLAEQTPLPPSAQWTDAGVPVPASAGRCAAQDPAAQDPAAQDPAAPDPAAPDSVRWCMPDGTSVATVDRWYRDVLPAGRDAGDLRWCVEQRRGDGSRRALWSTGAGLVGYVLPPLPPRPPAQELEDPVAVEVVVLPDEACHPATRAGREQT